MKRAKITVVLTCFNRKKMTIAAIQSIQEQNAKNEYDFVVVDDGSTDGTAEDLAKLPYSITILEGNGSLFWNGGMYKAIAHVLEQREADYCLWINDDVRFYEGAIDALIERLQQYREVTDAENITGMEPKAAVAVGATESTSGQLSYGGTRLLSRHFAKFALVPPSDEITLCDTFNGNCVLIPFDVLELAGNVDPHYIHSMSDYDYGMHLRRMGVEIINSATMVGQCNDNAIAGSWRDTTLSRKERLQKKESPKGLPKRDWFYFIRKNYGILPAVYHSVTPYVRILLGK